MTVLGATPNTWATSFAVMGLPRSSSFITGPFSPDGYAAKSAKVNNVLTGLVVAGAKAVLRPR
jgi:hypothetical protein